jgi:large subunit ribosomal protein L3
VIGPNGVVAGCTVVEAGPCLVTQVRTKDVDGYEAVQLGYGHKKRINEPEKGHFKNLGNFRHLREFKADTLDGITVGQRFGAELFQPGDRVDVQGVTKGRGFAGVVKRHGFHGGPKTHGQSDRHRAPGSIGSGTTPGRVLKGLKMAGHMGDRNLTVRNLEVVESNPDRGILILKGAVPGSRNGLIRIRKATTGSKRKSLK